MTDTAQNIMLLFQKHAKVEPGMVLTFTEMSCRAKEWGPRHSALLEAAMKELQDAGYALITTPHGLELTESGYSYLFKE